MNTAPYIFREMKVIICKLQGVTARKIVCRMWFVMFTEGRSAKLLQELWNISTLDIPVVKKNSVTSNGRGGF